jgi:hypothetical protein
MRRVLMFILGILVVALLAHDLLWPLLRERHTQQLLQRVWSDWSQGDNGR